MINLTTGVGNIHGGFFMPERYLYASAKGAYDEGGLPAYENAQYYRNNTTMNTLDATHNAVDTSNNTMDTSNNDVDAWQNAKDAT